MWTKIEKEKFQAALKEGYFEEAVEAAMKAIAIEAKIRKQEIKTDKISERLEHMRHAWNVAHSELDQLQAESRWALRSVVACTESDEETRLAYKEARKRLRKRTTKA